MKKIIYFICFILLLVSCSNNNNIQKEGIYKIYFSQSIIYNNSVGNDWNYIYKCGDTLLNNGDIVVGDILNIDIQVIEKDNIDDISTAAATINIKDGENKKVYLIVEENAGKYKGNTAKIEITISIIEY